jgi:hypothetical protein
LAVLRFLADHHWPFGGEFDGLWDGLVGMLTAELGMEP